VNSNGVEFELEKKSCQTVDFNFELNLTDLFVNFKQAKLKLEKKISVKLELNFKLNRFLSSQIELK
jgi:hypothetical protein